MTQIWERLFVGSLQDAQRISQKNLNGIATVITLCEQCVEGKASDVRYVHLPIEDDEPVPVRQFNAVMDAIAVSIRTGNVLVHCAVGFSRSPTMAAAYITRVGFADFDDALAEIERLRPITDPSETLLNSVKEYL
jgi:protein-tyrosine phosphatase